MPNEDKIFVKIR